MWNLLLSALAPVVWGSTYLVTTEFLPPDRPLLVGALRALPVGLWIVISSRKFPRGSWWWRATVLGILNIGLFFALLFLAAYRLPGGVAATLGAIQPLLVASLGWLLLSQKPSIFTLLSGLGGMIGVALLVITPTSHLDPVGVGAALGGTVSMAAGIVLTKRWVRPVSLLVFTGWQLVVGGIFLALFSLLIEGVPPRLSATNLIGFAYLGLVGTGLAYTLWFRGIETLGLSISFLGLLSPVVATLLGYVILDQRLTTVQLLGMFLVLGSVFAGQWLSQMKGDKNLQPPHPIKTLVKGGSYE
jgi:probable blue pigment (indigoidine) exporter